MKFFRLLRLCFATLAATLAARADPPPVLIASTDSNPLVWDAMEKQQVLPGMTNLAVFTFWVTNNSTSEAVIGSVVAECDCTVIDAGKVFPWTIAPGKGGPLNIRVNIRGRFGDFVKTVTVHSAHGPQVLTVSMKIPLTPAPSNVSVRQRDLMMAKADRQALFRGSCAVCHAAPTAGLTGAALFTKACAICHQAETRAEMVPDLAALKHPTDADHWRRWITSGKAGTVMPAFAHGEGGILNPSQIESLVEYAMKKFPSVNSAATKQPPSTANQVNASSSSRLPENRSERSSSKSE
jgi:mono/diheme cytochrome c family protein